MKFTLKQLQVFDAIAQCHNVSHAANKLAMSQSAASMALAQLESQLGQTLFERRGKKLLLNSWGNWLQAKAKPLITDALKIELGFHGQHNHSGELAFGASQTLGEVLVPKLICDLDANFPQLRVDLNVGNSRQIVKGVLDCKYDLGVIEGRCDDERIIAQHWCSDKLLVVSGLNHALAEHKELNVEQMQNAKWVLREKGAGTRDIFDYAIHNKLSQLQVWREYNHVPTLIALAKSGQYLTCLPQSSVQDHISRGELMVFETSLQMKRVFSFIMRKASQQDPLIQCVLEQAKPIGVKPVPAFAG